MRQKNNSIFLDRIFFLTGNNIDLKSYNPIVNIPEKYYLLFKNRQKYFSSTLHEVANFVDIILSRKEEYGNINLDKWDRFNRNKSFLVLNRLDQSPIIDELIFDVIKQLKLKIRNIWPKGKMAAVCLTHDVDSFDGTSYLWLRKLSWLSKSCSSLLRLKMGESKNWLKKIERWHKVKKDPIFAFDRWMELEAKYDFRSTFFFMSLKKTLSKEGRRYSYKDPRVARVMKELNKGDWEVGLHAAAYDHLGLNYLKEQKHNLEDKLDEEILGCRQHYIRVRFPKTWILYEKAGFKYSSNMGWTSNFNGFRAGTCFPYLPIKENDKIKLWEIPFQLMDSSVIENPDAYIKLFLDYLDKVKKVNGCLVIDFHQEHFDEEEAPGVNVTYKEILNILSNDEEVLVAKLKDIYKYLNSL